MIFTFSEGSWPTLSASAVALCLTASLLHAQERVVAGEEVREAIIARLSAAGETAAPSVLPEKQFYLCDAPLQVEPAFGSWRSVKVICPSPAQWSIAVRAQVKGAAPSSMSQTPDATLVQAVYLTRPLRRGDRVQPGDVELRPVDPLSSASVYASVDQVIGRALNQSMAPNVPVMPRHLEREWSVEENDVLELRIMRGGIEIISTGVALETGQFGATIQVSNARSGAPLLGRIVGDKKVDIIAKGRK